MHAARARRRAALRRRSAPARGAPTGGRPRSRRTTRREPGPASPPRRADMRLVQVNGEPGVLFLDDRPAPDSALVLVRARRPGAPLLQPAQPREAASPALSRGTVGVVAGVGVPRDQRLGAVLLEEAELVAVGVAQHVDRTVGRAVGDAPVGEARRRQACDQRRRDRGRSRSGDSSASAGARRAAPAGRRRSRRIAGHLGAEASEVPEELGVEPRARRSRSRRARRRRRRRGRPADRGPARQPGTSDDAVAVVARTRAAGGRAARARRARRRAGGSRGDGERPSSRRHPRVSSRTVVTGLGRNTRRPNGNTSSSPSSSTAKRHGSMRPCSHDAQHEHGGELDPVAPVRSPRPRARARAGSWATSGGTRCCLRRTRSRPPRQGYARLREHVTCDDQPMVERNAATANPAAAASPACRPAPRTAIGTISLTHTTIIAPAAMVWMIAMRSASVGFRIA